MRSRSGPVGPRYAKKRNIPQRAEPGIEAGQAKLGGGGGLAWLAAALSLLFRWLELNGENETGEREKG